MIRPELFNVFLLKYNTKGALCDWISLDPQIIRNSVFADYMEGLSLLNACRRSKVLRNVLTERWTFILFQSKFDK